MQLKSQGVVIAGLMPEMYFYCGVADIVFQQELGQEFTLTNGLAGRNYKSFHTQGRAVDGRTMYWFDAARWRHNAEMLRVVEILRRELDTRGYDIVLEPDELTPANILARFQDDEQLDRLIGHHNRTAVTDAQLEILRREIHPHLHCEFDPKEGETLWPIVD